MIRSENALMDISNQIHMEVNAILNQLGHPALSTDKAASLKGQLRNLGDKNNAVRVLIGKLLKFGLMQIYLDIKSDEFQLQTLNHKYHSQNMCSICRMISIKVSF